MRDYLRRIRCGALAASVVIGLALFPLAIQAAELNASLVKIFGGDSVPASVSELKLMQDHLQKLSETLIPCTVGVRVGPAQGSGVIISEDGYVLTAAHVVMKPNIDVTFVLHDGRTVKGKTLGMNRAIDAGLMKITEEGKYPHVEMGVSNGLKEGQWCVATGHPGGYEKGRQPVVRFGRILQNHDSVITSDCTLVGGDSGGPLFDMDGKVIGINSRIAGPLNANMHVPVNTFRDTWDRLKNAEVWGSTPGSAPFFGVQGEPDVKEARIAKVFANTPAEKAGLKVGDLIVEFDGKQIDEFAALSKLVADRAPGDKVKVKVKRGEETLEFEVTIGRRGEQ
jgi:serine protease Do